MKIRSLLVSALMLILFVDQGIGADKVLFEASPGWIEPVPVGLDGLVAVDNTSDGALDILLREQQSRVGPLGIERFYRSVKRVKSAVGMESLGNVLVSYDPSYQTLVWHSVRVFRGGRWLDKKKPTQFDNFRQESETDSSIYSGNMTSSLRLEDLRVDDVLEVSYSRRGSNPLIGDHLSEFVSLDSDGLTHHFYYRALVPETHGLQWYSYGDRQVVPDIQKTGNQLTLTLDMNEVPVESRDTGAPSHYFNSFLQVGGKLDWLGIKQWGSGLFNSALLGQDQSGLRSTLAELTNDNLNQEITNAIRWVQDEIRYTGLEFADNALRPFSPDEVLQRRFGDCKDKTLLLVEMLRTMGVSAYPALVKISGGEILKELHPSHRLFDHAIVAVEKEQGGYFWIDPTQYLTGGTYPNLAEPDYGWALVLAEGVSELTDMHLAGASRGSQVIKHNYQLEAPEERSSFDSVTQYQDAEADRVRVNLAASSRGEIQKLYQDYYEDRLGVKLEVEDFHWEDDRVKNIITTYESYTTEPLWSSDSESSWAVYFSPIEVADLLKKEAGDNRTTPLSFSGVDSVDQEIRVSLYEAWPNWSDDDSFDDEAFSVTGSASIKSKQVLFKYKFERLNSIIPVDRVAEFMANLKAAEDTLDYKLNTPKLTNVISDLKQNKINPGMLFAAAFGLLLGGVISLMLNRINPLSANKVRKSSEPHGLGGWLVLLSIVVVLNALGGIALVYMDFEMAISNWSTFTEQVSDVGMSVTTLAMINIMCDATLVPTMMIVAVSFFNRRTNFPVVFMAVVTLSYVFSLLLSYLSKGTSLEEDTHLLRAALVTVLWFSYLLKSTRVANTFIKRSGHHAVTPHSETVQATS